MDPDSGALRQPDLLALVDGRWSSWAGLAPLPNDAEVAERLGDPIDASPVGGIFAGSPTIYRRYASPGSSLPTIVWFENDLAVAVQLDDAQRHVDDGELPRPDLELESAFGNRWRQLVYADRGLVLHVPVGEPIGRARLVIGLPPFTVDDFLDDPVRHLGGDRRLG